ncbi:MAG: class I SAM-dependent methyltransferase [Patescibacteria group bacterium]|jgi:ubiquinone/menaquinone biosynthesis C-methylase UbiE
MKPATAEKLLNKVRFDYNQIAEDFSYSRSYPWGEFKILNEYIKDGQNVLDIGCGNGRLTESFKQKKIFYNGIDSSTNLIMMAQRKYPKHLFQTGDMLAIPFVKEEFNVAMAIAVFHHIPSLKLRREALREVSRVLKPKSYFLMTNWNLWQKKYKNLNYKYGLQKILRLNDFDQGDVLVPWKNSKGKIIQKRYYHSFKLKELNDLAKSTGFKIIKQYYSLRGAKSDIKSASNILSIWQKN